MLKDVVTEKGDVSVKQCIELLFKRHVGCVVIVDGSNKCTGIFTERDAIRTVAQDVPLDSKVEKIMTKNPFTINEDSSFEEAKNVIKTNKIRHLPVTAADGRLVGLISARHILDEICGI
jgi:CBS domain-containing protein